VPGTIRVMIVADHPIMLDGLRMTFARQKDMVVVCEATDLAQVLRDFEPCRPDVTIIDLQRPAGEGWRAVKALRQRFPGCALVVFTTYPGEAAAAGDGISTTLEVSKTASGTEIIMATRKAAQAQQS
jgi:two-component system, NarL family, nitrate/nitrite response regulator NarL